MDEVKYTIDVLQPPNMKAKFWLDIILVIAIAGFIFIYLSYDRNTALLFGIPISAYWLYRGVMSNWFYILHIEVSLNIIRIKYKSYDNEISLEGDIGAFSFKKKFAFNRTRDPYLAVYFNGELVLRQYERGNWKEEMFDKIVFEVEQIKKNGF